MKLSSFARLLMLCKDTSDTQPAATMTAIWDSALARKPTQALILDRSITVTKGAGGCGNKWDSACSKGTRTGQFTKVMNETRRFYLATEGIGC